MEGWKDGRMEGWRIGRMRDLENNVLPQSSRLPFFHSSILPFSARIYGRAEAWKVGGMEGWIEAWRGGWMEGWGRYGVITAEEY
jgi:hypothetical protein